MKNYKLSRRSALRMLGMAGAASMFPGGLGLSRALAQSTSNIPKRILFFYTNHGTHRPAWVPKGVGGAAVSETSWDLNEILVPLAAYKKDLLILDGLDMLSSDVQSGPAKNAHIRGHCHSMVAADMASADLAGGISIDQHIAQALNKPTPITPLPSLEIGIEPNQESLISFSAASQKLPIEMSPQKAFSRLFPGGAAPGSMMAAQDKTPEQQRSVLDFALAEYNTLAPKLDRDARMRCEAHAAAVRDLETRLGIAVQRSCTAPQLAAATSRNSDYAAYYTSTADNFMRLIQAAFACDLTRVITFSPEAIPDALSGYKSINGSTDMHDMIHKVAMRNDALSKDATAVGIVKNFHTEYAKLFAKLLGYLSQMKEADGQSMLAHTIVLWCGEIAEGNHDLHMLPWLIAGQGGGSVRTGRYLQIPRSPKARGHNDLYVSLANAMGSNITTFGNASVCKGPITLT
ncbi:MAG TPA: DUF1552 domain-containing protein [Polyangiales bacterium]|nr:DUF1552 domain-containing protein [Polyangiales bacterium]